MKHSSRRNIAGWLPVLVCLSLTGCLNLKPAQSHSRHFVLSSMSPSPGATNAGAASSLVIGLGTVRLPAYLMRTVMAVRVGPTEVKYLQDSLWAERLDAACQRVLTANLEELLPGSQVSNSGGGFCDVRVSVQQFDVDKDGNAILWTRWRIVSPAQQRPMQTGETRLKRQGPSPFSDPGAAAETLSELLADFSKELAGIIEKHRVEQAPKQ